VVERRPERAGLPEPEHEEVARRPARQHSGGRAGLGLVWRGVSPDVA
jgi:hypothetical protein